MTGVLNVLKPPGMTSHDVVDFVRGLVGRRTKVGHAGTLDPAAAGVLALCLGRATKLVEYIMAGDKAYRAEIALGVATDSLDADGIITEEADASRVTRTEVAQALQALVGEQMMTPPMYSAVRVDGTRLYDLARQGKAVEREARPVTVYSADLVDFRPGAMAEALADITCSKGTYVRVLAEQLGQRLDIPAHLSFLVRTAVGPLGLAEAHTLEELEAARRRSELADLIVAPATALSNVPAVALDAEAALAFCRGNSPRCFTELTGLARVDDEQGRMLGMGEIVESDRGRVIQPRKVLSAS